MELVLPWFDIIFLVTLGAAFVGTIYVIWHRTRSTKCEMGMLYDGLVVDQSKADSETKLGYFQICFCVVRNIGLFILSAFLVWNFLKYGRSVYIYYNELQLDAQTQQVPCYFIFGDSLVDNGNNNFLNTTAKVNYAPYGIDYPTGPTGRFSNGRNMADFLAEFLGFEKSIPANAYAKGKEIIKGVNYGSGASGILDETAEEVGERISLSEQLRNHKIRVSQIAEFLGENTTDYLKSCLYSVTIGSNDYINNYLKTDYYNTSSEYTPTDYASTLIQQYSEHLTTLYSYGARKIAIFGLGLLGCTPYEIAEADSSSCSTTADTDAQYFDIELPLLVDALTKNLTDSKFIYINSTHIGLTPTPDSGITIAYIPCCNTSSTIGAGQCIPNESPCDNRTTHTFFDGFHPTEYYSQLTTMRAYSAATSLDVYPFDIKTLAELQL